MAGAHSSNLISINVIIFGVTNSPLVSKSDYYENIGGAYQARAGEYQLVLVGRYLETIMEDKNCTKATTEMGGMGASMGEQCIRSGDGHPC